MNFTAEQTAIIDAAVNTSTNLAIIARAGAAKTTTLIKIAEALPKVPMLCLAFNKSVAEEMRVRLPRNCESKTLHAIGYKAWFSFIRRKTTLENGKVYRLTKSLISTYDEDERVLFYEEMGDLMKFINDGKTAGWLPEEYKGHWRPLINDKEFFEALPRELSPVEEDLIKTVSVQSFKESLNGFIDFNDMIFCPAICGVSWPSFPLTLIDEAQDLSPINHHILKKMVRRDRIIAVGDPFQAIYGFRGASTRSMENLIEMFDMQTFKLTITFRCGKEIVRNAQWRAPDMTAFPSNVDGQVERPSSWKTGDFIAGDAIICRNNAPLFSVAIKLIKEGQLPELSGRDIGKSIVKVIKKLGADDPPKDEAREKLQEWRDKELDRAREGAEGRIHDMFACVNILLAEVETLGETKAYLNHLLSREGRILLMTGHKSKGLEFNNVWFLDQFLCRLKYEQDANLKYVIETRAKERLSYIQSDDFISAQVE